MTTFTPAPGRLAPFAAALALLLASPAARGQSTVTLDGTSGANSISTTYTLSGNTTFDLGFFVDYLIVGGGGGGGQGTGGGGGAGGLLQQSGFRVTSGSNSIAVGAGGQPTTGRGGKGGDSTAFGQTAVGGGGGGGNVGGSANQAGGSGGSGGGGSEASGTGGSATSGQGNAGGTTTSTVFAPPNYPAAGGGGAGSAGGSPATASSNGAAGGNGLQSSITGSAVIYAGGGGGGVFANGTGGAGGSGGGGKGGDAATDNATAGTNGLGGGGGGSGGNRTSGAKAGGSGVVIIRYAGDATGITGGNPTAGTGTAAGTTISTFTSGTQTFGVDFAARLGAALTQPIGGTGNLTYSGPGRLTLAANSSYTGNTAVSAGTLQVGNGGTAGTLGSGTVSIASGSTLAFNRSDAIVQSGAISGSGGLVQQGTGSLVLAADNTFAGTATITGGTLQVGNGGSTGSLGTANVVNNSTLAVNRTGSLTLGNVISGSGTLEQAGAGTTILTGANSYAGTTTISAGTLQVGSGGTAGTLGSGGVTNNASLVFSRSDDLTAANAITGSGSLMQQGSGQLTLSGTSDYSGGTTIAAGSVLAASSSALGSGGVTLAGGALRTIPGITLANTITLSAAAGSLRLGSELPPVEYLIVGGGGGGGAGFFDTASGGGGGAGGMVEGTAVLAAPSYTVTVGAGGAGGADFSTPGSNGSDSTAFGVTAVGGGRGGQWRNFGEGTYVGSGGSGGGGGTSRGGSQGGAGTNGQGFGGGTAADYIEQTLRGSGGGGGAGGAGASVASTSAAGGAGGVGASSSITGSAVTYAAGGGGGGGTGGAGTSGISGAGGSADTAGGNGTANTGGGGGGGGPATQAGPSFSGGSGGSGIVILRYQGSPIATGGTVTAGTGTANGYTLHTFTDVGTGTFAIDLPVVQTILSGDITGTGGFTLDTQSTLVLTGANSYQGDTIISDGVLQIGNNTTTGSLGSGSVTNDAAIVFNRSNAIAIANPISGSGSLTQAGSGTLTLSGANTYSGGTVVSAGTLVGTTASLQGNIANASALIFDDATGGTFAGVISGAGTFEKTGAGTVTLSGANTFTGGLTVSAGTLATNAASRLAVTVAPDVASNATLSLGGDQTLAVVTGSGTLDLAAGTLSVGATTGEFAGTITGAGNLVKTGAGTLTLSGAASSFTGTTTLSAGELVLASANALGTASVLSMAAGTTLTLNQRTIVGDVDQFGGTITGPGELVSTLVRTQSGTLDIVIADGDDFARGIRKTSGGTTTVTAANTFTGQVRVEAGTLALGTGGSFAGGASALLEGGTLDLNGTATTFTALDGTGGTVALGAGTLTVNNATTSTFAGVISGLGGLVKSAAGNLVLSGVNGYTGPTSITAGRLSVNGSLGNSAVTVQNGAELGGIGTLGGAVTAQSGGRVSPGNSIGVLTQGTTSFDAGAIFKYEVDSTNLSALGTAADLLVVNGGLDIAAGTLLEFSDLAGLSAQPFVEDTTVFAMINYTGDWDGGFFTYNSQTLTNGSRFMVGSQLWEIDYAYVYDTATPGSTVRPLNFQGSHLPASGTQTFVTVTVVPEPATLALLAAAAGLIALTHRRRADLESARQQIRA